MPESLRARIERAADAPGALCVLTGAGMSAESGIPTFRDAITGLWSQVDPARLASEAGFRDDPGFVWDWYADRREGVRQAEPNAGHLALGRYAARHPGAMTVVSQNVDDLHQRAGNADTIRLHGDILQDRWLDPCPRHDKPCDPAGAAPGRPPRCASCGHLVRPGVVWFGEMLDPACMEAAQAAARSARVLLVVGTAGAVWPAAGLAYEARQHGAHVVVINPRASEIDDAAHELIRSTAAVALPELLESA